MVNDLALPPILFVPLIIAFIVDGSQFMDANIIAIDNVGVAIVR